MRSNRVLRRIVSFLVGYDVFLSYRHADVRKYASELKRDLEDRGLLVFHDESDEDAGAETARFSKLESRARALVVVVSANVSHSNNVKAEVAAYFENRVDRWHMRPFSRVIPINVNQSITKLQTGDSTWSRLSQLVYIDETEEAATLAQPTKAVLDRLSKGAYLLRSWSLFASATGLATLIVLTSLTIASLRLKEQVRKLNTAELGARTLREEIQSLSATGSHLREVNDNLAAQGDQLQFRLAARQFLTTDPVISYRIAQQAFEQGRTAADRELLLAAVSLGDLNYQRVVAGCEVVHVQGTWAVLGCTDQNKIPMAKLFDLKSDRPAGQGTLGERVWFIPLRGSGRFLRQQRGMVELLDLGFHRIGPPIMTTRAFPVVFCTPQVVLVDLDGSSAIVWDLERDSRKLQQTEPVPLFKNLGIDLGGLPLACSPSQVIAEYTALYGGTLFLISEGQRSAASETRVSMNVNAGTGSWSPDGRYMAIRVPDGQRLGLWEPTHAHFQWLDPDGWVATSYAWMGDHTLVFAGQTEFKNDVTVRLFDPDADESARLLHSLTEPIIDLAVEPKGSRIAAADSAGNVLLINASDGSVITTGRHMGISRIRWAEAAIISSGGGQTRLWQPAPSPVTTWTHRSTSDHAYFPCAAGDPGWRWHAMMFGNATSRGVEVDDVATGMQRLLPLPSSSFTRALREDAADVNISKATDCRALIFSPDGEWLAAATNDVLRFWDTRNWHAHDIELQTGDKGLQGLTIASGFLRVQSTNSSGKDVTYTIKLNSESGTASPYAREVQHSSSTSSCVPNPWAGSLIRGWNSKLATTRYQTETIMSCVDTGWITRALCRFSNLWDCDIEFVPADFDRLNHFLDPLYWRPDRDDFERIGLHMSR